MTTIIRLKAPGGIEQLERATVRRRWTARLPLQLAQAIARPLRPPRWPLVCKRRRRNWQRRRLR